jgi:hypothetical protein
MSVEMRNELRRKKKQFDSLPKARQDELREFHRRLEAHEKSSELKQVMHRDAEWLTTLSDSHRVRLLDLQPQERLERIREIKKAQDIEIFGRAGATRLPEEDAKTVYNWFEHIVEKKSTEIRSKIRQLIADGKLSPNCLNWPTTRLLQAIINGAPEQLEGLIKPADIEELKSLLTTSQSLRIVEELPESELPQLILRWIQVASEIKNRPIVIVTEADLQHVYEHYLTPDQRDELDRMDPQRRNEVLKLTFFRLRRSGELKTRPPTAVDSRTVNEHEQ